MSYKLLSYLTGGEISAGILINGFVYPAATLAQNAAYASVLDILEDWPAADAIFAQAAGRRGDEQRRAGGIPLTSVRLLAPVLYPGEIFGAGANYLDHADEMFRALKLPAGQNMKELGEKPWHFIKTAKASVVGDGATIALPAYSKAVDWEIELAAVIGRIASDVPVEEALEYVAGYTIANDLSVRDETRRVNLSASSPQYYDRLSGKCFTGSCPLGPWIVPASQIADPQSLALKLWVNGELMQDSNTGKMIFDTAEQIAMLSSRVVLQPGDVVLTGTPAGVGMSRGVFLKPGDTVRLWIERIGELTHTMAEPKSRSHTSCSGAGADLPAGKRVPVRGDRR